VSDLFCPIKLKWVGFLPPTDSGWKTTLQTCVFFILTSAFFTYYTDGFLRMLIQMFADVRWVGFLPPLSLGHIFSCVQPFYD